ncbi:cupin domain-containing protein [Halobacillus halophilus]|uniref:cupin domain-containing protein n=1 Tax=Halobacillus halophilus TaxID=1570 RepID=UPI001CD4AC87|nr:cupin domain-containing protein [Halobacillus halophilus]MCA1010184.1 cupin domain-containing protein [Halobacillus halophilus]
MNTSIDRILLKEDGYYPNHPYLPALVYRQAIDMPTKDAERLFKKNRWSNTWVGGIFDYHHYHSRTHEILGVIAGSARLKLGGPHGQILEVKKGDLIILPAGVAHKNEGATVDFQVLAAYPFGESFDLKTGDKKEYEEALAQIPDAPAPAADPLLGENGPLMELWNRS